MNKRARLTPDNMSDTFTSLRGLMTSVGDEPPEGPGPAILEVELGRIRANPEQPRHATSAAMSKASLQDLAEDIKQHGLLHPILVKDTGRFYQIVAGERRYRACQLLGMERVPVRLIEPKTDQEELEIALAENLQRRNLSPLEEARSFRILIERYGLSYRDLAKLSARSLAHVHGRLQLLEHADVQQAVEAKHVGVADAIQLARVPDEAARKELLAAVQDGTLRGQALHRKVQGFLGELAPVEPSTEMPVQEATQATPWSVPSALEDALALIEALDDDMSETDRELLHTLARLAAKRLDMRLEYNSPPPVIAVPVVLPPKPEPATQRVPEPVPVLEERVPAPMDAAARKVVSRAKEYRDARGYTLANLIRVYWMNMQRRGYVFTPGEWRAEPADDGRYAVTFSYRVDNEPRSFEWWYDSSGSLTPANEDAKGIYG